MNWILCEQVMSLPPSDSAIAVFEARPYWGPELQRQFAGMTVVVKESRSFNDLLPSIEGFERALIVVDMDADLESFFDWLGSSWKKRSSRCSLVICASGENKDLEWILRDAGVTAFLTEIVPGDAFASLCRKQLGLHQSIKP